MDFDFDRISIKLGPWKFGLNLKPRQMDDTFRQALVHLSIAKLLSSTSVAQLLHASGALHFACGSQWAS